MRPSNRFALPSVIQIVVLFFIPPCAGSDVQEVPFELRGHLVTVEGSANGVEGLSMIIDTGATCTVINRPLARRLHLKGRQRETVVWGRKSRVEETRLERLVIGGQSFEGVDARIGDIPRLERAAVDILVGLDLLRRTTVTIDYPARGLSLGPADGLSRGQSFYPNLPFVLLKMKVGEQSLTLILDTGSPHLVLFRPEVEGRVALQLTNDSKWIEHLRGQVQLRKASLANARLSEDLLAPLTAYLLEMPGEVYGGADGMVSPLSVGITRIQLDFAHNRVSWEM